MSQPKSSATGEQSSGSIPASSSVPLSERPLVVREQNTVISGKPEPAATAPDRNENLPLRQRLFPADGSEPGSEAGVRLAHFEIRERIGAGGMGAVFRGVDTELSREVAIKVLHPGSTRDTSMIARFRNESRACAQLSHDNIARVYYAGSQDGLFFIAYEFARGKTLRDLILESDRLTPAEAVNYAIQITLALNHLSASGVVHRDIKPSNLMLTDGGRIKVVDFGLARRETDDSIGHITVAGTTLGTFDYIAPEQARDPRLADIRSDIYSLGCTMYHMLSGNPPYPEGTALQKLLDHQGKSPPRLSSVNPEVPEELSAIADRNRRLQRHVGHAHDVQRSGPTISVSRSPVE
ncbi:MAG: serine/threonine-protein kinase [Planctomycetaceae bacterium]